MWIGFGVLAVFPVLGVTAFDKPVVHHSGSTRYFLSGPEASGEGEDRSDGFPVFAGSTARVGEVASIDASTTRLRARLLAGGAFVLDGGLYRLVEDTLFTSPSITSPSIAAATLLGRTANGRIERKDASNVTLKDRQAQAAG